MGQKKDPNAMIKEAQRAEELAVAKALIVREAAIAAAQTFRHYAQIHRDKGDEAKAARNEDEAVKLTLAIMATANLPDFRALSKQFEEECRALRSRVAELEDSVRIAKSGRDAVVAGRDSSHQVNAKLLADLDTARSEVARLTAEVEARKSGSDIWHRAAIEAQDERDALRAEVEAMRAVVEAAERLTAALASSRILSRGNARVVSPPGLGLDESQDRAVAALDALRARKVGG